MSRSDDLDRNIERLRMMPQGIPCACGGKMYTNVSATVQRNPLLEYTCSECPITLSTPLRLLLKRLAKITPDPSRAFLAEARRYLAHPEHAEHECRNYCVKAGLRCPIHDADRRAGGGA